MIENKEVHGMPSIRPISDLRSNANEISDFCRQTREPVYITRNGTGDMVVISMEEYERQQALIDLYGNWPWRNRRSPPVRRVRIS